MDREVQMSESPLVIAVDSSTTSSKAIIVNTEGEVLALGKREIALRTPQQGFGEHDPRAWCPAALRRGPAPGAAARRRARGGASLRCLFWPLCLGQVRWSGVSVLSESVDRGTVSGSVLGSGSGLMLVH